jgi:hypothetical protein
MREGRRARRNVDEIGGCFAPVLPMNVSTMVLRRSSEFKLLRVWQSWIARYLIMFERQFG